MDDFGWMTLDEAAAYLKVKKGTLERWIQQERVRAYPLFSGRGHRLKRDDLDELLILPRRTLDELQPRMAEFGVYNGGNPDFQLIAQMVRDASTGLAEWPRQSVELYLAKAEASNDPNTYRGRYVRQAHQALLEYVDRKEKRSSNLPGSPQVSSQP